MIPLVLGLISDRLDTLPHALHATVRSIEWCHFATRANALGDSKKENTIVTKHGHGDRVTPIDPNDAKKDALKALLPNFLRRRADDVKKIRAALAVGDFESIEAIGHKLRGNGATYGFPLLSEIGALLETGATNRDRETIDREVERLEAELARVEGAIATG